MRLKKSSFSLIELLIGAAVLVVALGGLIAVFAANFSLVDSGRNLTVAVNHAQCVIEEIRDRNIPSAIVLEDWNNWAATDMTAGGGGCTALPNENVVVTYPSGTAAIPLEILVTVNWTEKTRPMSTQLVTLLTAR